MRSITYIIIMVFFSPMITNAGFFGPSSYEECILENMKDVKSDQAAREIQRACRNKFPVPVQETIDRKRSDFPGFPFASDTYGKRLLNWYISTQEPAIRTPEEVARIAYEEGRGVPPHDDYKGWSENNDINFFLTKAYEFKEFLKGD